MRTLLAPKEAAPVLHISIQTITAMVKLGAPVHRWGTTGRRYLIDVDEWMEWQDNFHKEYEQKRGHGPAAARGNVVEFSAAQMAQRRHELLAAIG